jgi:hypothetical protein
MLARQPITARVWPSSAWGEMRGRETEWARTAAVCEMLLRRKEGQLRNSEQRVWGRAAGGCTCMHAWEEGAVQACKGARRCCRCSAGKASGSE